MLSEWTEPEKGGSILCVDACASVFDEHVHYDVVLSICSHFWCFILWIY